MLGSALGGLFGAAGLQGSARQSQLQMEMAQRDLDYRLWQQQMMMNTYPPGGMIRVPSGYLSKGKRNTLTTCAYCGRQTNEPDLEYGCRGCGAYEWEF